VAPFNLNANRNANESPNFEPSVTVLVPPTIGTIDPFSENQLTDQDILCWYIYSPLYTGDDDRSLADAALRSNNLPGCTQRQSANLVTWRYTVTITATSQLGANPDFFPRQPLVGETFTVDQVFDPLTPDSDTRAIFGRYVGANRSFTLTFANMPAIVLLSQEFPVLNFTNNGIGINDGTTTPSADAYSASMEGSSIARTLRIDLDGATSATVFTSDAVPNVPPDPNSFTRTRTAYFAVRGSTVTGRIESIVRVQ
jgi:hypothetical protein